MSDETLTGCDNRWSRIKAAADELYLVAAEFRSLLRIDCQHLMDVANNVKDWNERQRFGWCRRFDVAILDLLDVAGHILATEVVENSVSRWAHKSMTDNVRLIRLLTAERIQVNDRSAAPINHGKIITLERTGTQ